jgi:hypothetical protein
MKQQQQKKKKQKQQSRTVNETGNSKSVLEFAGVCERDALSHLLGFAEGFTRMKFRLFPVMVFYSFVLQLHNDWKMLTDLCVCVCVFSVSHLLQLSADHKPSQLLDQMLEILLFWISLQLSQPQWNLGRSN